MEKLFFEDYGQVLLPFSVYLVFILLIFTVFAFRRDASARQRRLRPALLLLSVWAWLGNTPLIANALVQSLEGQYVVPLVPDSPIKPGQVIVVLSTGEARQTRQGEFVLMNHASWERTYAAVHLWRQLKGTVIFSGYPVGSGRGAVARKMAEIAMEMGIPRENIVVEEDGQNTYENMLYSRNLVQTTFEPDDVEAIWLVTSAFHMPRAMAVARKLEMKVQPYPCDFRSQEATGIADILPHNGAVALMQVAAHEYIGRLYYWMRDRI